MMLFLRLYGERPGPCDQETEHIHGEPIKNAGGRFAGLCSTGTDGAVQAADVRLG